MLRIRDKHHAKHGVSWDAPNATPVYAVAKDPHVHMPHYYQTPNACQTLTSDEEERFLAAFRARMMDNEHPPADANKSRTRNDVKEDVNREAEEFIEEEHKRFELSKQMSKRAG